MSFSRLRSPLLIVVVMFIAGEPSLLHAQDLDSDSAGRNKAAIESQQLFQAIEEKGREFDQIERDIAEASGGNKEALEKRASALAARLIQDIQTLAATVVAQEEHGEDASADRDRVKKMLQGVSDYIRRAIERLDAEMGDLETRHESVTPGEAVEIEDRLIVLDERLHRALEMFLGQIEVMESFGLDTESNVEFLSSFVEERATLLAGRMWHRFLYVHGRGH